MVQSLAKELALDTNLVLDLAEEADFAHTFKETFQERGYSLRVPPTAALELHENLVYSPTARQRELSRIALQNLRAWGLRVIDLSELEQPLAEQFGRKLSERGLLPAEELHDGTILAETSLANITVLVTSDKHLLDIDEEALLLAFNDAHLLPAHPVHPKRLLRALR